MRDMGTKKSIDNIWERYAKTLKLLSNALEELEKKPKEVIIEKIVEVEKVVEVPVEVQGPNMYPLKEQGYELRIKQLESQISGLRKQLQTFGAENEKLELVYQEMVNEFGQHPEFDLDLTKDESWMPATKKKND